jgi:hypothetical protein
MDLVEIVEIEWGDVDLIGLSQDGGNLRALVNAVMKLRGSVECGDIIEWLHDWWLSISAQIHRVNYILEDILSMTCIIFGKSIAICRVKSKGHVLYLRAKSLSQTFAAGYYRKNCVSVVQ